MVAFEDHTPAQPTVIITTMGPQNLGTFNSRLRQRASGIQTGPRGSGGMAPRPSLRNRMKG
jgi:hypothetical protein